MLVGANAAHGAAYAPRGYWGREKSKASVRASRELCASGAGSGHDPAIFGKLVHERPVERDILLRGARFSGTDAKFLGKLLPLFKGPAISVRSSPSPELSEWSGTSEHLSPLSSRGPVWFRSEAKSMKHSILFAVSLIAVSLSACGKKEETPAVPASDSSPSAATASPAASPGQTFADTAAASDTFEIETSKLAATKAQSDKVKRFAQAMIKAHTESTAKLKTAAAAATSAINPAVVLTPTQQRTLDDLSTKSGADFDRAYAEAQRAAHQGTLNALKPYSASGDIPSLKSFATERVPMVTAHLNMAKAL